jgi:hypothetical protein
MEFDIRQPVYTHTELAEFLLEEKVTLMETMRINRKGLAKDMNSLLGREEILTIVWHKSSPGKKAIISFAVYSKSMGEEDECCCALSPT